MDDRYTPYKPGELLAGPRTGNLRTRMSGPAGFTAEPGMGQMHRNAERLLAEAGANQLDLGNGLVIARNAVGGVSIRTGRVRTQVEPKVQPEDAAKPRLLTPLDALSVMGLPQPTAPARQAPSQQVPTGFTMPELPDFEVERA